MQITLESNLIFLIIKKGQLPVDNKFINIGKYIDN